jgi:hypothetical protein
VQKSSAEFRAHLAAITKIVDRWMSGEFSTAQKREQIAAENAFWYGREKRSPATGELLTAAKGPVSHVLAAPAPEPDPDPWGEDDDDEGLEWWQK